MPKKAPAKRPSKLYFITLLIASTNYWQILSVAAQRPDSAIALAVDRFARRMRKHPSEIECIALERTGTAKNDIERVIKYH